MRPTGVDVPEAVGSKIGMSTVKIRQHVTYLSKPIGSDNKQVLFATSDFSKVNVFVGAARPNQSTWTQDRRSGLYITLQCLQSCNTLMDAARK